MPVIIPSDLPASSLLSQENPAYIAPDGAKPDIILGFINLMPVKADTERDFLRIIAPCAHTVDVRLVNMISHHSRNTSAEHIRNFYTGFNTLNVQPDCAIITGAPLENVSFENVDYWQEITDIFDRLRHDGIPTLYICWAAYAALYHFHGVKMQLLSEKLSGVYPHRIDRPDAALLKDIEEPFFIPHSRFASWNYDEILSIDDITADASGQQQGPYMLSSKLYPEHYITGHGEYDVLTLDSEYRRDLGKGMNPHIPVNYYPDNDPSRQPVDRWHNPAVTIMGNWLDEVMRHKINKPTNIQEND